MALEAPSQLAFALGAGLFGLCVGSFLNVAIHRYGRTDQTVNHPRRSYCPHCNHTLGWTENLPLASFLMQGGRCRHCRAPISWRYPLVEVLNAGLWLLAAWLAGPQQWPLAAVHCTALSALLVATFVDLDHFEIPDGVSIGGMLVAPLASALVPALHAESLIARSAAGPHGEIGWWEAGLASLAGIAVGAGVLWLIGKLGKLAFGKEAMGFGDVKLLGAAGGFVGPGGAMVALMLASCLGAVVGVANVLRFAALSSGRARRRGRGAELARALRVGRMCGSYIPFGPALAVGIGIALLAWNELAGWIGSRA
ncbi:MAG: prepilin peptidase [Planctomycetota bacterium]|nr:MAG: prepilin peptidase [Planctomycetota bacterium]